MRKPQMEHDAMSDDWKRDSRPKRGAWAPGDYFGLCFKCKQRFIGDKRAMWCADCAYAEPDVVPTPEPAAGAVAKNISMLADIWANSEWQHGYAVALKTDVSDRHKIREACKENFRAALASVSAPPGWVMVPVEPTEAMTAAGNRASADLSNSIQAVYRALIAASVKP